MEITNDAKLKKTKNGNGEESHSPILIPTESIIEGYIKTKKSFRIECKYFGTIMSSQKVVVGESSKIIGDIICRNLVLSGELKGNIFCSGKITVHKGSKIKGKVYTQLFENDSDSELDCIVQIPEIQHIKSVEELLDKLDTDQPLSVDDTLDQIRSIFYNNVYAHKSEVDKPLVYEFTNQREKGTSDLPVTSEDEGKKVPAQESPSSKALQQKDQN